MKKKITMKVMVVAGVMALAGWVMSGSAWATGIAGSAHDFSQTGSYSVSTEICNVCHTPHNADTSFTGAPLWNHATTTATFTPYVSPTGTLDATVGQPDSASLACLSCHDGTVAIDNFGGVTNGTVVMTGDAKLGTDLKNDHPISFTYNDSLASDDGGLFAPSTATTSLGGTIDADLLIGGKVECSSCHDVHDAAGNDDLLVIANTGSALCLTCHNK